MTSRRKQAKDLAQWEADTRAWATDTARDLASDLYYDRNTGAQPFQVGVVLDPGERVWAETPLPDQGRGDLLDPELLQSAGKGDRESLFLVGSEPAEEDHGRFVFRRT